MRILIIEFMSLDGVVQAPGGPDEDTDGGFAHGGWSQPFFDPEVVGGAFTDAMTETEALLFGRRTWQMMATARAHTATLATFDRRVRRALPEAGLELNKMLR